MTLYKALNGQLNGQLRGPCQHETWPAAPGEWATAHAAPRYGASGFHCLGSVRAVLEFFAGYWSPGAHLWLVEVGGATAPTPWGVTAERCRLLERVPGWRDDVLVPLAREIAEIVFRATVDAVAAGTVNTLERERDGAGKWGIAQVPERDCHAGVKVPERLLPAVAHGEPPERPRPVRWIDPAVAARDAVLLAHADAPGYLTLAATLRAASAALGRPIDYVRKGPLPGDVLDSPIGERIVELAEAKITAPADARLPRTPRVRSVTRAAPGTRGGQARSGSW